MSEDTLKWSASFAIAPTSRSAKLQGDKLLLPPSALEQLLAAAPTVVSDALHPVTSSFDPFNPYTFAAERQARAQFQERSQVLPHPLTFRLVNPENGRVTYAGIREFSADDGEVVLSDALRESLGVKPTPVPSRQASPQNDDEDMEMTNGAAEPSKEKSFGRITVVAKQLAKGTYVKLRPLEAGYDPEDWKSLLEQYLRSNYTTLTNQEVLVVPGGRGIGGKKDEFRFLVDGFKPEGEAICVVDTDLEVDIEPLNEEQARETLKRIVAKSQRAPGSNKGSSIGGRLDLFKPQNGQVLDGEYVDFEIPSWDRSQGIEIELSAVDEDEEVDLYVSPHAPRQRARPRDDEYAFADTSSRYPKRTRIQPTNIELEDAGALWVSVHAYKSLGGAEESASPKQFTIRVAPFDPKLPPDEEATSADVTHNPGDVQCKNCLQWVPERTLMLHENFCLRNNILCPKGCNQVFQKRAEEWQNHWHCPHDSSYGNAPLSLAKHNHLTHTPQPCPSCDRTYSSLKVLASHRTSECPGKLILCQFCHLEVPQEGDPDAPNAEALLSGLTPHELADGGRTTECHLCNRIVRLRDMRVHLANHEHEKKNRPAPRACRNVLCGRTLDGTSHSGDTRAGTRMGNGPGNAIGLCSNCFGPLYVSMYDPENKALRRRIERRYLQQLVTGCGRNWCKNPYCKNGRKNTGVEGTVTMKEALPVVKPFLDGLMGDTTALHFCVDETSQKKRILAEMLAAERDLKGRGYGFEWCVAALEAEGGDLDKARTWLVGWAPVVGE